MNETNEAVRIPVHGMTCTDCETHVVKALENMGASNVTADFRKGEARFEIALNTDIETAKKAISDSGYIPGEEEILISQEGREQDGEWEYDLLIIGSGGAAFSAAIEAVQHKAKVAMIERGTIGGTCVNIGCIPSKTLLRAGEINHLAFQNPFIGLQTSAGPVDLAALIKEKNELVNDLRQQKYINLIDDYGFELIQGEARFLDHKTVDVNGRKITAKSFLISTGASPAVPNIPGLTDVDYLTSTSALQLEQLPKHLAVIGSGYIALELGQLFHHLGAEVTLMQRSDRVMKTYDPEISQAITDALTEQGINLVTGATFDRVERVGDMIGVHVTVAGQKRVIEADQILVATGRNPNTARLDVKAAGVELGATEEVIVDEYMRTSNPSIYAAGDVTMGPQFVYVAAHQGSVAAKNALGDSPQKIDLHVVPGVTFTHPSIATVGLTEEQAKKEGYEVKSSVLPLDAVPRGIVNRNTTGVFKLVADAKTLKLLGAHIVAENAGEVIYAATLAVKFGLTIADLSETLTPYLTMAEGLKLAALTFDKDVSKLSCCAG